MKSFCKIFLSCTGSAHTFDLNSYKVASRDPLSPDKLSLAIQDFYK